MTGFSRRDNMSVVSAILPPSAATRVIEHLFELGEHNTLLMNARGTLIRDRWYQSFLPVISPELDYLELLVPDTQVERVVEAIAITGHLNRPGAGAVFTVPCEQVEYGAKFDMWTDVEADRSGYDATDFLKENLTAIFCIAQPENVETISRAAMQAGAHGPVVFYCEGRGLRDRLGWLKITKKGTKEVIVVVVDNVDKIAVTEAMVEAGRLDLPGRGFLYRMPVRQGLINLPTTVGNRGHAANMQQVIAAIDSLKGSTDWRDQSVVELGAAGKSAGISVFGRLKKREWLVEQACLGCIVSRKHAQTVLDAILAGGAEGANVSYAKFIEAEGRTTRSGARFNRESGFIRSIVSKTRYDEVKEAAKAACVREGIEDIAIFALPVTRAITYVSRADPNRETTQTYRGVRV